MVTCLLMRSVISSAICDARSSRADARAAALTDRWGASCMGQSIRTKAGCARALRTPSSDGAADHRPASWAQRKMRASPMQGEGYWGGVYRVTEVIGVSDGFRE